MPDAGPEPIGSGQQLVTPPAASMSPFLRWYALAALVLLPLVVYCRSLSSGLLGLDDTIYFQSNVLLHSGGLAGLKELWTRPYFDDYAPITQLTIWVDTALRHGDSCVLIRVHHLLWMGLCALAVFQIMRRVSGHVGLSWAVALLYVLHPVSAESALWVAERKNLVGIALSLWSVERHIAWRQGAGRVALAASLVLCPLALLAKAHAVIIPAVIACYEAFLGGGSRVRRVVEVLPSGIMTLLFVVGCMMVIHLYHGTVRMQVGGSLAASVLCDGAILARYLMHVVLPYHLAIFYCVIEDPQRWPALLGWWLAVLGAVALSMVVVRERRLALFAWCAAGCSILPAINLKPLPVPMSDHYLQWSLPWLLLILALLVSSLMQYARGREWQASARWATCGYAAFLLLISVARIPEFSSQAKLAQTGVLNQGDCAINWGMYCFTQQYKSPPDVREAGRAGMIAYSCTDYKRIFATYQNSCAIMAAVECRRLYGEQASRQLLAKAMSLMSKEVQCYVQGMVYFNEGRYAEATAVLSGPYTPSVQEAARSVGGLCRSGDQQPWDFPSAVDPEDRQTVDPNRIRQRNAFSFQIFCLLSESYCQAGDPASAFDLAALLVNMDPGNTDALNVYIFACQQLGLLHSAELARQRIVAAGAAATD